MKRRKFSTEQVKIRPSRISHDVFSKDVMERRLEQVNPSSAITKSLRRSCLHSKRQIAAALPRQSESGRLMQARLGGCRSTGTFDLQIERAPDGKSAPLLSESLSVTKNALAFNLVGAEANQRLQCRQLTKACR
jgi:hypothetical protein